MFLFLQRDGACSPEKDHKFTRPGAPKLVAEVSGNGTLGYFREIQVGGNIII